MIYLYDLTRIDDLKAHLSENKKIDVTTILSYDFSNMSELEEICNEIGLSDNLVVDLSALMNTSVFNSCYIGRIFSVLNRELDSPVFLLNKVKYDAVLKELPLLFEDEEINKDFSELKIQRFMGDEIIVAADDAKFIDNIQKVSSKLIGHGLFKSEFTQKYANFLLLEKVDARKIFSIFLIGESGIGKTEFAKILSKSLYPEEELIKINFGNYSTEGVLNSLIGSPLGYIGSDDSGELIKKINSSRSKVILIDEFEKANPAVFNFFYELLEDGKFTDRHGIAHNLSGYTIIFTSNMTPEYYIQHIPNPLKSRFDLLCDFQIPSIQEKKLFIQEQVHILVDKLNRNLKKSYEVTAELMNELLNFSEENNLRHIKRLVQDKIAEDFSKNQSIK